MTKPVDESLCTVHVKIVIDQNPRFSNDVTYFLESFIVAVSTVLELRTENHKRREDNLSVLCGFF